VQQWPAATNGIGRIGWKKTRECIQTILQSTFGRSRLVELGRLWWVLLTGLAPLGTRPRCLLFPFPDSWWHLFHLPDSVLVPDPHPSRCTHRLLNPYCCLSKKKLWSLRLSRWWPLLCLISKLQEQVLSLDSFLWWAAGHPLLLLTQKLNSILSHLSLDY
jgi:hypothetical protein